MSIKRISLFLITTFYIIGCSQEAQYARAIEKVLQEDSKYSSALDELSGINQSDPDYIDKVVAVHNKVVVLMKSIDTSDCPEDFRLAYYNHIQAWKNTGEAIESKNTKDFEYFYNRIGETFRVVEKIAISHKARLVEQMK